MHSIANHKTLRTAAQHIAKNDPTLSLIIAREGLATFVPHTNYFHALIDSIIGQQLSVKAARNIRTRFYALFMDNLLPSPEQILDKTFEDLRGVGFSGAKVHYVQDLAQRVHEGTLKFDEIDTLSNDDIIKELTAVKGVGEWTAHMFMMFCMGRLDVLPIGDLGIKNGIMKLYNLESVPTPEQVQEIAVRHSWHPYETVASWYIWRSLDNMPKP